MVSDNEVILRLAKKIVTKYNITPPFDLDAIVSIYSEIIYKVIPIEGVDGVTLNLKTPGKHPKIIVNSKISPSRQKFTLAHEFGHVIIPWHIGTIVDDTNYFWDTETLYSKLENEANQFAAEILMPDVWMVKLLQEQDPIKIFNRIYSTANVSPISAAIRLINYLPENWIFIYEENTVIRFSGKSPNTTAYLPKKDETLNFEIKKYCQYFQTTAINKGNYHWLKWKDEIDIKSFTHESWRQILEKIIEDLGIDDVKKYKMSLNGVIGSANSQMKLKNEAYNKSSLTARCIERINRKGFDDLLNHYLFEEFIDKRINELMN